MLPTITSAVWLILAVVFFVRVRQWNKRLSELYDDIKRDFEESKEAE